MARAGLRIRWLLSTMAEDLESVELLRLHKLTRDVAAQCAKQLRQYLEYIASLLRPRRLLGDYIEGVSKEPVVGAERNFADLRALYRKVAIKFDLRPELEAPLQSVSTQFQLQEWEYNHALQTEKGWQSIRVIKPLTWVLSYTSPYGLSTMRDVTAGIVHPDPESVRSFVVRACLMHEMFRAFPALTDLLSALRFRIAIETCAPLGDLPLVTISAPFRTFRPSDSLVAMASGLAGGATFTEVLAVDSVRNLSDPLREQAVATMRQHNVEV
jgi:hypothetical protein